MKKIITIVLAIGLATSAFAIHEKYVQGYEFKPSKVNTESNDRAMSFLKNKVVYSVQDTAAGSAIKLYVADVIEQDIELDNAEFSQELTDLGIFGTFAYDESLNKIYFSHYDKATKNYMLYESTQTEEKTWTSPKRLKIAGLQGYRKDGSPLVNAGWLYRAPGLSGFFNPTLADGGKRIYFSADFPIGNGERDIWYVEKEDDTHWSMPQNPGTNVNTKGKEDYPFVIGDKLYFSSDTETNGGTDLFVSEKEGNAWGVAKPLDSVYNSSADDYNLIGTENTIFFVSGRHEGYADDIYRPARLLLEPCPTLAESTPESEPIIQMKTFPWKLFYFDFDKDILNEEFLIELDQLYNTMIDFMQDNDFVIRGHTDSRGTDEYNMRLSKRRAQRIQKLLAEKGIPAKIMHIEPYGESQPVIPDAQTEEEHAQNRRVEVDIVRKNN
ncbi:MAG: OmpA family protein [Prevotellaceae bacterium]|jgi:outer membrane protein OmpA-like peptidoglycan-associated protein|nr:OmpA family protein [Prevotellaceae bacterium]